jgi:ABC-type bacteriocin/lantibiotic exporter with double-glycine peptidase domain
MLTNQHIYHTLQEIGLATKHAISPDDLHHVESNQRTYLDDLDEFKRDLVEAGNKIRIMFLENELEPSAFIDFLRSHQAPVLVFSNDEHPVPMLVTPSGKDITVQLIGEHGAHEKLISQLGKTNFRKNEKGAIPFFGIFNYETPVGAPEDGLHISPVRRLMQLLGTERKEILYILFYAVIIGFVSLALPLGIQTTVELVSGGVFFSSVYLMIGVVIVGVLVTGLLQIIQIGLVEFLQRRIFAKAAFEFAFRIPRLKLERIQESYPPELVNRFFDVLTIQKGLPKLLIDLSSSVIQILFGLLLISLYHPFFVFFGLVLIATLVLIFYITGPRGLSSSILESKYKYKVAQWLEELARAMPSFKMAGNTDLPIRKTDYNVNNYLKNRKVHFNTLITQFSFILIFKAMITGGLLIMGTLLVVDRQITLGQFVASEVIIILILNAVEKIIMYMDVVYDLLTAVDKVSHVTDLPIEKTGGFDLPKPKMGFEVKIKNLTYYFENETRPALDSLNLSIAPGESLCVAGGTGSGKTTLANILVGFYNNYKGIVTVNNHSLHDLDTTHLRDQVAKNISQEDLFDGTLLENLTLGKPGATIEDCHQVLEAMGMLHFVHTLPNGFNTHILSGGKGLTQNFIQKLILARCLLKKPRLMILNDFFFTFSKREKMKVVDCLLGQRPSLTLLTFSNDPLIMSVCDRVAILESGKIISEGSFDDMMKKGVLEEII